MSSEAWRVMMPWNQVAKPPMPVLWLVSPMAAPFAISLPAVSRHLKVLEQARLITRTPDGQHRRCSLRPEALESAADWLAFHRRFWSESFDRLEEELRQSAKNKEETHGASRKTSRK